MQILGNAVAAISGRAAERDSSQKTDKIIRKWELYKHLCIAKTIYGLNDRCLTVLNSLLSFLTDDVITAKSKLVVFPSNKQISIRAHMMPESTLRRHISSLIKAGIITRNDSPNYKRYAHKNGAGEVELAFGLNLTCFFAKASEIKSAADRIQDEMRAIKRMRDEVSIMRRDIAKTFEMSSIRDVEAIFTRFRDVVEGIPRRASLKELTTIKASLEKITNDLNILLKNNNNMEDMSANDAQIERQHIESFSESHFQNKNEVFDLKERMSKPFLHQTGSSQPLSIPLEIVLKTCPDIKAYCSSDIRNWRDLIDASRIVASFLRISNLVYIDAVKVFGIQLASAAIANILQNAEKIVSPGGYLRSLINKRRSGSFSVVEMITNQLKACS